MFDRRNECLKIVEAFDGKADHVHELAALFLHIGMEEVTKRGIEFEELLIKELGCSIGDRRDLLERSLHQLFRLFGHCNIEYSE